MAETSGNKPGSIWTANTVALLRRLAKAKMSAREIAAQIPGATRMSVIGKCHRLDIALERSTEKQRRTSLQAYARAPGSLRASLARWDSVASNSGKIAR
jgi:hypothetical protein